MKKNNKSSSRGLHPHEEESVIVRGKREESREEGRAEGRKEGRREGGKKGLQCIA